jgi:nifR3 family TIM-barrel protein
MVNNLANYLRQPLKIGQKTIDSRLVLAPMTFLGHVAFRELVARYGGYGLLYSEMCSARALPNENRFISSYFKWRDEEASKLVCQIFGRDPGLMARAAHRVETEGFFGVDINFGCASGSICRQNCGAAVLKDPALAVSIVGEVRQAVSIPLSVKFRTGWRDDPHYAVDLACRFEAAGADALIFHPRVAPDRRTRPPRWDYIAMVKRAVGIPVFGNGDVFDQNDCQTIINETGCDGVAVGRMAIAKPWIFAEWSNIMQTSPDMYLESALQLIGFLNKHYDPIGAVRRFKRFAYYYAANFKFGHTLHSRLKNADNLMQLEQILHGFFQSPPELVARPNLNFFY